MFNKELHVNKTVAIDEHKNIIIQTPKTKASRRTISLDKGTLAILNDWKVQQRTEYLKLDYNTSSEEQYVLQHLKTRYTFQTL